MRKLFLLLSLFLIGSITLRSQSMNTKKWRAGERDSMERAQLLFDEGNYGMVIPIIDKLLKEHPNELFLKYMDGLCGLYRSDRHKQSLTYLTEVYAKNKKITDIEFELARANHLNYKFDEALKLLEEHKKKSKKTDAKHQKEVEQLTAYCNNAKVMVASPLPAKITNIGKPVNTPDNEYVPVVSSDESVMIYTYRGSKSVGGLQNAYNEPDPYGVYFEDVFITYKENGEWQTPRSIGDSINTKEHDATVSISNDGTKLFIYKDDRNNGGDIYLSTLNGKYWSAPKRLEGDVNSLAWEGSCSLSADGKNLFFSSERSGGMGGKDLYVSHLQPDGTWGHAKNLGSKINTRFDDDAVFLHPDGRILIFSSNGRNSMGGYDIFRSVLNLQDSTWSEPENLGYPINTPDDDIFYVLSSDGQKGYYASGHEDGEGLQDIYTVYPGLIGVSPYLAMLKGNVTIDNEAVDATITIAIEGKGEYAKIVSNSSSGKYLVNLPGGSVYKITYSYQGQADQYKTLDLTSLNGYQEKNIDINFSRLGVAIKDTTVVMNNTDTIKAQPFGTNPLTGNETINGLIFKVQIAAYRLPENYNYNKLKGLGQVEKQDIDGIVRFTIGGEFTSLNAVNNHCKKVRAAGQTDAFVTAIYKGKRVYLEQLEKEGLIPVLPK